MLASQLVLLTVDVTNQKKQKCVGSHPGTALETQGFARAADPILEVLGRESHRTATLRSPSGAVNHTYIPFATGLRETRQQRDKLLQTQVISRIRNGGFGSFLSPSTRNSHAKVQGPYGTNLLSP